MKKPQLRFLAFAIAVLAIVGVSLSSFLRHEYLRRHPEYFADSLITDEKVYFELAPTVRDEIAMRAYDFDRNERVSAFGKLSVRPQLADANGNVPAFSNDGDVIIVLFKWVNVSSGLAISKDPSFSEKLEAVDPHFRARQLREWIYVWDLDLQRPRIRSPKD